MEPSALFGLGIVLGMLLMGCLVGVHLLLYMFKSLERCLDELDENTDT